MGALELITPEGYRSDGRLAAESREVDIQFPGVGEAIFRIGNTVAKVAVHGPHEGKKNAGVICVDYVSVATDRRGKDLGMPLT